MARVNYGYEKRQKEIAKQKKKEAKRKKKQERKAAKAGGQAEVNDASEKELEGTEEDREEPTA